ncbi:probable N-acetyltransferase 14 [Mobula hypostoma]|uniref:probable N-acetyltransferase 14 n=1 Tax=Mobula hypostoma TaxID=723540 RepID=UPI002FC30D57
MPLHDLGKVECRQIRECDRDIVLEIMRECWGESENRLLLFALTRPPSLLLLALASSALRFLLASSAAALLLPLLLAAALLKLALVSLRRPPSSSSGSDALLVASLSTGEVCGVLELAPPQTMESHCAEVTCLAVSRFRRRGGAGSALLEGAEVRAKDAGCQQVLVRLRTTDRGALALFRGRGYRPVGDGDTERVEGMGGGAGCCWGVLVVQLCRGATVEYIKEL